MSDISLLFPVILPMFAVMKRRPIHCASFFFGVRIMLGTILGRFSILYFRGLGLRIRVRVWVWVRVSVSVSVMARVRVSVVL